MPYIIVYITYPTDLAPEVTEKFFEVVKELPFEKELGKETIPVASNANTHGIEVISIMEVKKGKLEEAWAWGRKRMGMFQSIKGLEYEMRLWSTLAEALEGTDYSHPE
ncbi:MAG: hypothetical protein HWN80_04630 [Candidatus Lokiarchaeota archaeon]|nr:hypothetical protein [Candidatus Lokiarchaeota archaeon]